MTVVREALLKLSRSGAMKSTITRAPLTRDVVNRYVAGETTDDVLRITRTLADANLSVTIDRLGEDTTKVEQAAETTRAYLELLGLLDDAGLADIAEVSIKLSAVGQFLGRDGERIATEHARSICEAAGAVGTTVTIDMEDAVGGPGAASGLPVAGHGAAGLSAPLRGGLS